MVDNSPEMKNVFKKPSLVAYKRHKNLQDIHLKGAAKCKVLVFYQLYITI